MFWHGLTTEAGSGVDVLHRVNNLPAGKSLSEAILELPQRGDTIHLDQKLERTTILTEGAMEQFQIALARYLATKDS